MNAHAGVKAILGYDIVDGVGIAEYETWLAEVHFPDLLANPHLDRLVINTVDRPIVATSAGTAPMADPTTFYRIVELHFTNYEEYERYLKWFDANPIPHERGPAGRTDFRFYVLTESSIVDRDTPYRFSPTDSHQQ